MADSISYVGGVAFGKDIGPIRTPLSTSSRFVSYVYSCLALVMINSYCANLMAFLVEEKISLPITGVHDPKVSVHEWMAENVPRNLGTLPDSNPNLVPRSTSFLVFELTNTVTILVKSIGNFALLPT